MNPTPEQSFASRGLSELRSQIQAGIDSGEPQPLDIEDVIKRGKDRYAQRQK
jgi:hypothetical protein